ncbi:glycosyl transferase [Pseudoflavitalea sp. X16]|uniref:glycosyl transferase n=1 Tax=Paraflavitalea devenefica TaxID=2716334 RepID=UPI00141D92E7|nr:glycosyl transferase [Paraflavitalea devenefica]NII29556.1 glycosyl transferase [Paraflavitalea devenefica]
MHNFCTLFDTNYLTRGLALYHSLVQHCPSFHLYVFAFDNDCYRYLKQKQYPHLTVVSLREFEDPALLEIKPTRSIAEYCWTCTSSTILYCLREFRLPSCTYLDADLFFYQDPQVLFDQMGNQSVMISRHRYTRVYDQSAMSGIYCVQFMCFKNDERGLKALTWWRDRCIEWCYARFEAGKFGDQKYLDDWTTRFEGVHVIRHPGEGLAPWNIQQYRVLPDGEIPVVQLRANQQSPTPAIYFHFHGVKFFTDNKVAFCGPMYELEEPAKKAFYFPYIRRLLSLAQQVHQDGFPLNVQGARQASEPRSKTIYQYLQKLPVMLLKDPSLLLTPKKITFARHDHVFDLKAFV